MEKINCTVMGRESGGIAKSWCCKTICSDRDSRLEDLLHVSRHCQ
jgi:hypothetical protein